MITTFYTIRNTTVLIMSAPIMSAPTMPRFDRSSDFTGDMSAEEWLDRLDYDFEISKLPNPEPALYLRVIAILLKGEP